MGGWKILEKFNRSEVGIIGRLEIIENLINLDLKHLEYFIYLYYWPDDSN